MVWKSGIGREYESSGFEAWKGKEFDFQVWKMNNLCRDCRYFANFKLPVMAGIEDDDDERYVWVLEKVAFWSGKGWEMVLIFMRQTVWEP